VYSADMVICVGHVPAWNTSECDNVREGLPVVLHLDMVDAVSITTA